MNSNRIWIDLSSFFSGVRQQSCIIVDHEKLKTVKDVEDHISRVFKLDSPFFILNDGWLLPSSESSLLFRDNDTISVIPQTESTSPHRTEESVKHSSLKNSVSSIPDPKNEKSVKHSSVKNSVSSIPDPKNEKSLNLICAEKEKQDGQSNSFEISVVRPKNPFARPITSVASDLKVDVEHAKKLANINGHSSATATEADGQDLDQSSNQENGTVTLKRKRIRRKRKKPAQDIDEGLKPTEVKHSRYVTNKLLQGVGHILNTSVATENKNQKHIFFQEDEGNNVHESRAEVPAAVVVKEEVPVSPCRTPPVVQSNDLSKLISLGSQKSPVVFERKKPDNNNLLNKITPTIPVSTKLTPLKEIPVKETILKFKILKMVNYSPIISGEITARVIHSDFSSQQIYMQITDGLNELETEKGKFSLDEDENSAMPPNPFKFYNWQDLIEPMAVEN